MPLKFSGSLEKTEFSDVIILKAASLPEDVCEQEDNSVAAGIRKKLAGTRRKLGKLKPGSIFVMPLGGGEKYRAVLSLVTEGLSEAELLDGYRRLLIHAEQLECESAVLSYLGGNFADVAAVVSQFLETSDIDVVFEYPFTDQIELSAEELSKIVEESGVLEKFKQIPLPEGAVPSVRYSISDVLFRGPTKAEILERLYKEIGERFDELCKNPEETFSEMLLRLIDESGRTDADVYHAANLDRRHFSKIRSNRDYAPTKRTALALALALKLDLDATKVLLYSAGFAMNASYFDEIIRLCIEHKFYDINEINILLFKYDEDLL